MNLAKTIRQSHRWLAVLFTVTVVITAVALSMPDPVLWISYIPLFPLALMFLSGAYLFFQPYTAKRRARRAAAD